MRYAIEKRYMHACRDSFLQRDRARRPWTRASATSSRNINFFMNVPVTAEGKLSFEDGISGPGKYVEMRAEMDIVVLISNCPQLNNPATPTTRRRCGIWCGTHSEEGASRGSRCEADLT